MNREEKRKWFKKMKRIKNFFTQPYKNGRTRERARQYYFPPKEKKEND